MGTWRAEGSFTHWRNGEPTCRRRGHEPRKAPDLPSYRLPCCVRHNARLNELYDEPGKGPVGVVLDQVQSLQGSDRVTKLARWWIKTILLLQHPETSSVLEGAENRSPWALPARIYDDLIDGNGRMPSDVSLWLGVADDATGTAQLRKAVRLYLPQTVTPRGDGGSPVTLLLGFRRQQRRIVLVQFVLHPLCDFQHPFEHEGLMVRVWPEPPDRLETTRPVLSREGRYQLGALFVDGGYAEGLPDGGWRAQVEANS